MLHNILSDGLNMTDKIPASPLDQLLTPEQAAKALAVSPRTVKQWLRDGKLPGVKLAGKVWRVKASDLQAFIKKWEQTKQAAPPDSGD